MAKSNPNPNPIKKPEPLETTMEPRTLPSVPRAIIILVLVALCILIFIRTLPSPPPSKGKGQTPQAEVWVHGWTDESSNRMNTMPTTVMIRGGIMNFSYIYGNGARGKGAGTLQSDGGYLGTWSDSCGSGTFWLKQEGSASHYTGWQTDKGKPGKKFPMFLARIN